MPTMADLLRVVTYAIRRLRHAPAPASGACRSDRGAARWISSGVRRAHL